MMGLDTRDIQAMKNPEFQKSFPMPEPWRIPCDGKCVVTAPRTSNQIPGHWSFRLPFLLESALPPEAPLFQAFWTVFSGKRGNFHQNGGISKPF